MKKKRKMYYGNYAMSHLLTVNFTNAFEFDNEIKNRILKN